MNRNESIKADERMVKAVFWLIIGLFLAVVVCIMASWIWAMWIATKVVVS